MDYLKIFLSSNPNKTEKHCFDMGYDCGMNGANETNCHFSLFSDVRGTRAWEQGKKQAEQDKAAQHSVQRTALPGEVISDFSSDADFRIESEGE